MAMDGLSLHAMLWEIRGLLGTRVDKVQQPDKDTLLLACHGSDCGRVKLLINIHNENGRIVSIKLMDAPGTADVGAGVTAKLIWLNADGFTAKSESMDFELS